MRVPVCCLLLQSLPVGIRYLCLRQQALLQLITAGLQGIAKSGVAEGATVYCLETPPATLLQWLFSIAE